MFPKIILCGILALILASRLVAIPLGNFSEDFQSLLTGIGRDVVPSLRLGALDGDLQGDASIDHFSITPLGLGFNFTNGLGTVLQPQYDSQWQYAVHLDNLVNSNVPSTSFERLMAYPSFKSSFGMAFGSWDATVSVMYLPAALSQAVAGLDSSGKVKQLSPQLSGGNLGLQIRKTLVHDSDQLDWAPGLSLGTGYHFSWFNFSSNITSFSSLGIGSQTVGPSQTLDLSGPISIQTLSQVVTLDLHISKRIVFVTPYLKLSGAYQNSTFTGNTDGLTATVTDASNSSNNSVQTLKASPVVNVSDFAFLANPGLELDIFSVIFNVNTIVDIGRANLNIRNWSADGIDANAFAINAGFRIVF